MLKRTVIKIHQPRGRRLRKLDAFRSSIPILEVPVLNEISRWGSFGGQE